MKLNKDGSIPKKRGPKGPRHVLTDHDFAMVKAYISAYCTKKEIADFLGMSEDKLRVLLLERGVKFKHFFDKRRSETKAKVRKAMLEKIEDGDTSMMIWWSKNYLGMSDKQEITSKVDVKVRSEVTADMTPEEAMRIVQDKIASTKTIH